MNIGGDRWRSVEIGRYRSISVDMGRYKFISVHIGRDRLNSIDIGRKRSRSNERVLVDRRKHYNIFISYMAVCDSPHSRLRV